MAVVAVRPLEHALSKRQRYAEEKHAEQEQKVSGALTSETTGTVW